MCVCVSVWVHVMVASGMASGHERELRNVKNRYNTRQKSGKMINDRKSQTSPDLSYKCIRINTKLRFA